MANPQPEPFVKFSKELFDALLLSAMPATHKEIVLAIIRRTYGDHGQKSAPISQSLLLQMTGRARNGLKRSLSDLVNEGVIVQVRPPTFSQPAVLRLNKDYEKWGRWSVLRDTTVALGQNLTEGHDTVPGEGHRGVPGEGHRGGGGEGHRGVPIEDIKTRDLGRLPVGGADAPDDDRFAGIDLDDDPPPQNGKGPKSESPPEDPPENAGTMVAYLVDHAGEIGFTLTGSKKGHFAKAIGDLWKAGVDPPLLREAIRKALAENKSPAHLVDVVNDLKGGRRARDSGRSIDGEW